MKKIILLFVLFLSLTGFTLLQFDCSDLIFFKEGTQTTITSYNSSGKITGSVRTSYTSVTRQTDGAVVSAHQEAFDKKGKSISKSDYTITCEKGIVYFDLKTLLPQEQAEAYKDFEMTVEGINRELPAELEVGTALKDASVKIKLKTKNGAEMPMMNTTVNITNRKVEAYEKVTTPAGTFDCYKITEDMHLKTIINVTMKSVSWFNKNSGIVKTESYKENGKLTGKTELTEISK